MAAQRRDGRLHAADRGGRLPPALRRRGAVERLRRQEPAQPARSGPAPACAGARLAQRDRRAGARTGGRGSRSRGGREARRRRAAERRRRPPIPAPAAHRARGGLDAAGVPPSERGRRAAGRLRDALERAARRLRGEYRRTSGASTRSSSSSSIRCSSSCTSAGGGSRRPASSNVPAHGRAMLVANHAGVLPVGRDDDERRDPEAAPAAALPALHGARLGVPAAVG